MSQVCDNEPKAALKPALSYVAAVYVCVWLLKNPLIDAPGALRALVALIPILPIVWMVRVKVAIILAGDELQRRIDLEAIAIASIAVGLGSLSAALLNVAKVWEAGVKTDLIWVLPALWLIYGVTRYWVSRRYR